MSLSAPTPVPSPVYCPAAPAVFAGLAPVPDCHGVTTSSACVGEVTIGRLTEQNPSGGMMSVMAMLQQQSDFSID
jgi:hypothetical protein